VALGALLAELAGAAVAVWLLRRELQRYPGSWAGTRLKDLKSYRALLMNFQWLTAYALDGIANAAEALVGKAIGARDQEGLRRTVRRTLAWSLGFGDTDYRKYRVMDCRFPNEGGVLGPNSLPTVRECLLPGEDRTWTFAWQQHDNAIVNWSDPCPTDGQLKQWLGKDLRAMDIASFVYWGGLVQAEGLTEYISNFRRRRSTTTGAAVFWMYNDVWPCVRSWTTVDHRLRRTPSFHPVRRAFQPVSVVVHEDGERIVITGVNDTPGEVRGELRHGLFAIAGGYPLERRGAVVLAPGAASELASFPRSAWGDIRSQLAFAELSVAGAVVARHRLMLPLPVELKWSPAAITVRVEQGRAVFTSATFAWGVCLDLDGERALDDNYFDLFPGAPHAIAWPHAEPPRIVNVGNLV